MPSFPSQQLPQTAANPAPTAVGFMGTAASVSSAPVPAYQPQALKVQGFRELSITSSPPTFFNPSTPSTFTAAAPPAPIYTNSGAAAAAVDTSPPSPPLSFGPTGLPLPELSAMEPSSKPINPAQAFTELKPSAYFACYRAHRQTTDEQFTIYSLANLSTLLAEMRRNEEKPVLRFLVDRNMHIWFAREKGKIASPAHFKMTGEHQNTARCITAGNIFLSADFSTLERFNNKSGDFQPSFDSLKWFIAILILNKDLRPFALPPKMIEVEMYHNEALTQLLVWSLSDLRTTLAKLSSSINLVELQQPPTLDKKLVSYSKKLAPAISSACKMLIEPSAFSPK